jgi:glycosyltransferase involved in cell wall biosynthesis
MPRPYRLAYLVSHPIPYQAPLLRYLAALPEIDLTVFFLSDISVREFRDPGFLVDLRWDVRLLDGYSYVFLPAYGGNGRLSFWRPFVHGLGRHLRRDRFDALWLHGWAHQANLRALVIAKRRGLKVLLRGESHLRDRPSHAARRRLRQLLLPRFLNSVDAFLAIGSWNRDFYLHYGVPSERIFMMPYAVDNDFFQRKASEMEAQRESLRAELGLAPGRSVILYCSKFLRRKRAGDLLEAYVRLSSDGRREPNPYLLFIGDGEERPRMERRVEELGWSSVKFLGFKNQTEMPGYYQLCDVFALPSEHEPWGLVVNEVMNAGKAVIVSDQVGAGADLVEDGKNGFVVPLADVGALAERLKRMTADPSLAARMGEESLRKISRWNFEADSQGLQRALESVLAGSRHAAILPRAESDVTGARE